MLLKNGNLMRVVYSAEPFQAGSVRDNESRMYYSCP